MPADTIKTDLLIERYKHTGDIAVRNQIVMQYSSLVRYIAISMKNVYMKYAEVEDIINECIISLIYAIDTFEPDKNVKFETYASIRIRGSVIDFIRKQDFIPRNIRKFTKDLEVAFAQLYAEQKREPSTQELAEKLGLPEDKFRKLLGDSASAATLSFEELLYENNFEIKDNQDDEFWEAEKGVFKNELTAELAKAINSLKDKEKTVISLYYYEKLKFSEIAKVLEVTESRVCQIHSKAVLKLRFYLSDYLK